MIPDSWVKGRKRGGDRGEKREGRRERGGEGKERENGGEREEREGVTLRAVTCFFLGSYPH